MTTFDKSSIRAFRFVRCSFDAETGVARLVYAFDEGPELTETVTLPGAPFSLDATRSRAVSTAAAAMRPMRWGEWGLPKVSLSGPPSQRNIASRASGASGVVAW